MNVSRDMKWLQSGYGSRTPLVQYDCRLPSRPIDCCLNWSHLQCSVDDRYSWTLMLWTPWHDWIMLVPIRVCGCISFRPSVVSPNRVSRSSVDCWSDRADRDKRQMIRVDLYIVTIPKSVGERDVQKSMVYNRWCRKETKRALFLRGNLYRRSRSTGAVRKIGKHICFKMLRFRKPIQTTN